MQHPQAQAIAAMPSLTSKEQAVWAACCASDQAFPECYVPHSYILKRSGLPPRSLGGVLISLKKKVYIFTFASREIFDVEITCTAREAFGLNRQDKQFCNHHHCICQARPR